MTPTLSDITDEEILWRSKPHFASFLLRKYSTIIPIIIFITLIIGLIATIVIIIIPLWRLLTYRHAEYVATTTGLIQFSGAIGRNYSRIKWENIQDLEVKIGLIDKIFGTGTIIAKVAGGNLQKGRNQQGWLTTRGIEFQSVEDPYDLVSKLQGYMKEHQQKNIKS